MPNEKTIDILWTQRARLDRTAPEAVNEKTANEGPIPHARLRSNSAFLCEINLIPALDPSQRRFVHFLLWNRYEALVPEMFEETKESAFITTAAMVPGADLSEKTISNIFS
jgi:hypothetical protein